MKQWIAGLAGGVCLLSAQVVMANGFLDDPRAETLIEELAEEGLDADQVRDWLSRGEFLESTRTNIAAPTERTSTWADYRPIFVNELSIERGREFMEEHAETLARVESELGVDPRIVTAIIGVETRYGRITGNHAVMNAIGTTAFSDSPRSGYFMRELKAFFRLVHEEGVDPMTLTGSYAGAMGVPQFMPSSFLAYAIDFDDDGRRDIWNNPVDAIGSVANYLAAHRWETGGPVAMRAHVDGDDFLDIVDNGQRRPHTTLGETRQAGWSPVRPLEDGREVSTLRLEGEHGAEFWYGFQNFYVITRYNHSISYAMAVYQLSREF
ncbi:lytic murein transglycosylase B [Natronospirillum operosum]|uniref:Lytic murein transglycosylase B n=1 Tax=Natronospirillum operosum TaxID=2759953 RepID=A0A4Z0WCV2_9GAMM|nr:lytic murein transglycosylase B [Natronospirillum operosum]TGG92754.1 lytic murein transglycosylase B [Natronospirillum operosum]